MPTQNISMTEELAQFVSEKVGSGDFASVSEVYREALRCYRDQDEAKKLYFLRLKNELDKGLEDSKNGRVREIDSAEEHEAFYSRIEGKVFSTKAHA